MIEEPGDIIWWPYVKDVKPERPPFSLSSHRIAVACISIISLISCFIDMATNDGADYYCCHYPISEDIASLRQLLLSFFQMANLLLLLAVMVENPVLVEVYVWYVLAFVLLGLFISLAQLLIRTKLTGARSAAIGALPEVAFLFVLFRCLPLVDKYGRDLKGVAETI